MDSPGRSFFFPAVAATVSDGGSLRGNDEDAARLQRSSGAASPPAAYDLALSAANSEDCSSSSPPQEAPRRSMRVRKKVTEDNRAREEARKMAIEDAATARQQKVKLREKEKVFKQELASIIAAGHVTAAVVESVFKKEDQKGKWLAHYVKVFRKNMKEDPAASTVTSEYAWEKHKHKFKDHYNSLPGEVLAACEQSPGGEDRPQHVRKRKAYLKAFAARKKVRPSTPPCELRRAVEKAYDVEIGRTQFCVNMRALENGEEIHVQGRPLVVPEAIEDALCWYVTFCFSRRFPLYKSQIKEYANKMLAQLGDQNPCKKGVTDSWYKRFLDRKVLRSGNVEGLDVKRAEYLTSENVFQSFLMLTEKLEGEKIIEKNPACPPGKNFSNWRDPSMKGIPKFFWNGKKMHRVIEFDESSVELGIKSDKNGKSKIERVVVPGEAKSIQVLMDRLPATRCSLLHAHTAGGMQLRLGLVFNCGDDALLSKFIRGSNGEKITTRFFGQDVEPFYDSNKFGAFKTDTIIKYLTCIKADYEAIGEPATKENKLFVYIDGCQTHISQPLLEWCVANHFVIILKLPYGSSILQSQDCYGGTFRTFKPALRVALILKVHNKVLQYNFASEEERRKKKMTKRLSPTDFVDCMLAPVKEACNMTRSLTALRVVGVNPLTFAPFYEIMAAEENTKAVAASSNKCISSRYASKYPDKIADAIGAFKTTLIDTFTAKPCTQLPTIEYSGEAASARDAAHNAVKAYHSADGDTLDDDDVNYVIDHGDAKRWTTLRAGGVWSKFRANPTGPMMMAYTAGAAAYKAFILSASKERTAARDAARSEKESDLKVTALALYDALKVDNFAVPVNTRSNKKDDFIALLFFFGRDFWDGNTLYLPPNPKNPKKGVVWEILARFCAAKCADASGEQSFCDYE